MQGVFAVSALWVLWILDLVMQLFFFCRVIVSVDLPVGFFLLSCCRGVWEKVAGRVSGVMTFYWWRHAGGAYWQHTPAVDAPILAKLCLLLTNLLGAEGKKQYLEKSRWGVRKAMLVDTRSGGATLAMGFTPSHSSVHRQAPKVSCVHVAGMSSAAFISATGHLPKKVLEHWLEDLWHPCGHTGTQRPH